MAVKYRANCNGGCGTLPHSTHDTPQDALAASVAHNRSEHGGDGLGVGYQSRYEGPISSVESMLPLFHDRRGGHMPASEIGKYYPPGSNDGLD